MPVEVHPENPVYIDDDHCVRTLGDVIVTFTQAPPLAVYLRAWAAETDRIVGQGGGLVVYTVIARQAPAPSEDMKAEIRRVMTRHKDKLRGLAYVVEGSGFSAAAVRSALTLISIVARYPYPQKTFSSVRDGSRWVAGLSGHDGASTGAVSAPELEDLVELMRAEHGRQCAKAG